MAERASGAKFNDLSISTLADRVGAGVFVGLPLYLLTEAYVMGPHRRHGDDITVRILAKGKTVTWLDISGGLVTSGGGRAVTGGNDYYFTGAYCPTSAVTVIGTSGQTITYWEGVKS